MVRFAHMAGVVGFGSALGLGLGWAIWGQSETPDAIVSALLQERCLTYVQGSEPDTDRLVKANIASDTGYVESDRHIVIMFSRNTYGPHCTVSDVLAPWSRPERDAVLEVTRQFAARHIVPLNGGVLVEEDVSMEGLGEPLIQWRRPDMAVGAFASFAYFAQQDHRETTIRVGTTKFIRPVQISEGSDA